MKDFNKEKLKKKIEVYRSFLNQKIVELKEQNLFKWLPMLIKLKNNE